MDEITLLSEQVEAAALAAVHAAAPDELRRELGLCLETIGTALVSIAGRDPGTLLNRAIGLGVEEGAERESVGDIVARYAGAGVERYYLHLHPEARPLELRDWVVEAGLERLRGWAKFRRSCQDPPGSRSDLRVREIGAEHADDFARIVVNAFGLAETSTPVLAALQLHPQWHLYVSFDGDTPAGAAALFVHEGVGWLDWAATLPEFRRRGSQGALLRRRIEDARAAGCRFVLTETGEAVDGDPQHSYRNILRAGFELMHVRENWGTKGDRSI